MEAQKVFEMGEERERRSEQAPSIQRSIMMWIRTTMHFARHDAARA